MTKKKFMSAGQVRAQFPQAREKFDEGLRMTDKEIDETDATFVLSSENKLIFYSHDEWTGAVWDELKEEWNTIDFHQAKDIK